MEIHNAFLVRLARLRHGSDDFDFRALEQFISTAVLDVGLLRAAFNDALEGVSPDSKTGEFRISSMQRDVMSHALIEAEEAIELVQEVWQLAHDRYAAEKSG